MLDTHRFIASSLRIACGRRADILPEIAALRLQVEVLGRQVARPRGVPIFKPPVLPVERPLAQGDWFLGGSDMP